MKKTVTYPAEWMPQSGVQLTWPHKKTDWKPVLKDAEDCFTRIATEIAKRELLLVVTSDVVNTQAALATCNRKNIRFVTVPSNDTWSRDHGGITVLRDGVPTVLDFCFNGWGQKFAADLDDKITGELFSRQVFAQGVQHKDLSHFVLEGGSIESDGAGTLLTTKECLLSLHRNDPSNQEEITAALKQFFGAHRVLWLENGFLAGDDTDSHIDTLARFCSADAIAYVQCRDEKDIHFDALKKMEDELLQFKTINGRPYKLVPLPMADPVFLNDTQLPATYANFLIINGAVLVPEYGSPKDNIAKQKLAPLFPGREIVGIDCRVLIQQHGSLHCVTMQYPKGVLI